MSRFASLTSRLVLTAVALVVAVSVLIGVAASLAMHRQLTAQLDEDIRHSVEQRPGPGTPPHNRDDGDFDPSNRGPGTLIAVFTDVGRRGLVLGDTPGDEQELSEAALDTLDKVPNDGEIHGVDLDGVGSYRVLVVEATGGTVVTGLPTTEIDEAVSALLGWEASLIVLGGVLAAAGGVLLVRRQLRPLTEVAATAHTVAELPLASGEIELAERVPAHLTDERTEVGKVGAALNTLLVHVESSLEARQRSEEQLRQFVADASHELRTPLATIAGYTELARTRPDDENVRTALAKVEEESDRMTALVEDMLLLARLDAGRPLVREPVDLTRLLVEAVNDARVLAPAHTWRLELPRGDDGPVEVTGDPQRLHQVVTNLLSNARKHTPAGTTVTVAVRPDGFSVHDDGPGFGEDFAPHAFERFARGDVSRQRTGGAGLGLSLVRAIVASHGGSVALTSRPGDTTVDVRLESGFAGPRG